MITLLLADDHHVVRAGLRTLLEAEPDFRVVGEAADGLQALQLVGELHPDVLVLDLMMPGLGGLEVTRRAQQTCGRTRVVILSMHANEAYVREALRHGALGYVLKDATAAALACAVREAVAGRRYLSPPLNERAIQAHAPGAAEAGLDPYDTLTGREREVLQLAAESNTTSEIAERLSISPRTAETHRANVMRKLGLHAQTDLIRYALRRGLLQLGD